MQQRAKKSKTGLSTKSYWLKLRSRHPSSQNLRLAIKVPVKAVYRHGSTTQVDVPYEINSIESIQNSASKFRMKECFAKVGVKTAEAFFVGQNTLKKVIGADQGFTFKELEDKDIPFPLVAKLNLGSRGRGMVKIDTIDHLKTFIENKVRGNNYYFERFYNFTREYRLHVDKQGCFYTCRKVLKNETPNDQRWYRNDSNCNWIKEENPLFDKPENWTEIEAECVKALNSVGLDIGACDVKVQSPKTKKREKLEFIIIEINSAPSFGDITLERYKARLPETLKHKYAILPNV